MSEEKTVVAIGIPVFVGLGTAEPVNVGIFEIAVGDNLSDVVADALQAMAQEIRTLGIPDQD